MYSSKIKKTDLRGILADSGPENAHRPQGAPGGSRRAQGGGPLGGRPGGGRTGENRGLLLLSSWKNRGEPGTGWAGRVCGGIGEGRGGSQGQPRPHQEHRVAQRSRQGCESRILRKLAANRAPSCYTSRLFLAWLNATVPETWTHRGFNMYKVPQCQLFSLHKPKTSQE